MNKYLTIEMLEMVCILVIFTDMSYIVIKQNSFTGFKWDYFLLSRFTITIRNVLADKKCEMSSFEMKTSYIVYTCIYIPIYIDTYKIKYR